MLVMVGMRTEAHSFRSQVEIGPVSLLGQLNRILAFSDASLKEEKLEGAVCEMKESLDV